MRTALICVLVAGLLPYLWTAVAKMLGPRYDNRSVREWQSRLTGVALRAHYAHLNAFEAFPLFAASVLAAMITHVEPARVSLLAIVFLLARLLHAFSYMADTAVARSLAWFVGIGCVVAISAQAIVAA